MHFGSHGPSKSWIPHRNEMNPEGLGRHHTGTTQVSPYHLITCATVGPHRIHYFSSDFHLADFLFCSPYKPTIIEHLLNLSTPSRSLQTNILYIIFIHIQITTAAFYYCE